MSLRHLKTYRLAASLLLFFPVLFVFVDLTGILPPWAMNLISSLQFVPSILKLVSGAGAAVIGLFIVTLLTVAFGRVYCSSICPLGTLQDMFSRLNRRRNSRRRFRFRRQNYLLHYGLLLLVVALLAGGSILLLTLLEPFSNFGRIVTTLVRPVAVAMNNGLAAGLSSFHVYSVYTIPFRLSTAGALFLSLLSAGVLFAMSYRYGRLFCNTLCPAGAVLGLISRISMFRIVIDKTACRDCGLCEKVCKTGCIDSREMHVDFSACVGCFNCFDACPTVGLKFRRRTRQLPVTREAPFSRRRRQVLQGTAAAAVMLALPEDTLRKALPLPTGRSRSRLPISPPGSTGVEPFTSRCTACHICVSACPTQVLTPAFLEYGPGGLFQPRMDYAVSTCNYDCVTCGEVCPSGAILPLLPDAKRLVQVGKAKFVRDDCIVVTKKTECGACSEHCPTKAVHMVKTDGLFLPEVNDELCIGCGSCEHPCPSTPNKAIYVEANPRHLTAKKPETKKPVPKAASGSDFPF